MGIIKHNFATQYIYNFYLNYQCKNCKYYIFVANAGRSGSVTLQKIFSSIEGCISLHEPSPKMLNEYLDENEKNKYFRNIFYTYKRVYIKRAAINRKYYVETNHMFIKNFASLAIDYFKDKCRVIHLKRDPIQIATSFYMLDRIPGKNKISKLYLLNHKEKDNLINIVDELNVLNNDVSDFYKCLWYVYEIEARIQKLKDTYSFLKIYDINTEELNNISSIINLLEFYEIKYDIKKLKSIIGVKMNRRDNEKKRTLTFDPSTLNDSIKRIITHKYPNYNF